MLGFLLRPGEKNIVHSQSEQNTTLRNKDTPIKFEYISSVDSRVKRRKKCNRLPFRLRFEYNLSWEFRIGQNVGRQMGSVLTLPPAFFQDSLLYHMPLVI